VNEILVYKLGSDKATLNLLLHSKTEISLTHKHRERERERELSLLQENTIPILISVEGKELVQGVLRLISLEIFEFVWWVLRI
jgi:hypothetical protein